MNSRTEWFEKARYGMFIHWGAYSAGGRGEWVMNREKIDLKTYTENFVAHFQAEKYDPHEWARLAKRWGFRYLVLTTRHHDGFALWDSDVNKFNAVRLGPKRDLVAPYVKALREEGLKVGLYYSPASWTNSDYPGAFFRDWPGKNDWKSEESRLRFISYYRSELNELLSRYGKIDYLWFDGCIPENIDGDETIRQIRRLQPEMLINNRLGGPFDIKTCEQTVNPAVEGQPWESCMTLNNTWGYTPADTNWKTPYAVEELLLRCAAKCGNLLLNVGPAPNGDIPPESVRILDEVGKWVNTNFAALESDRRSPFSWSTTACNSTVCGNRVYLPLRRDDHYLCWAELKNRVRKAWYLDDGTPIEFSQEGGKFLVKNPKWTTSWRIMVLETEGTPEAQTAQTTFWIPE